MEMSLQAFEQEFLPLKDKLYRFALRVMSSQMDAEDVVQEAYLKIWKKRTEWHAWENKEAMSMRIVKNLCIDKKRSKHSRVDSFPEHFEQVDDSLTPADEVSANNSMHRIQAMMNKLPDTQKMVIQLRDIEGYSYKEIAEMLNITMGQVKVNLHRARLYLKDQLIKTGAYGK